MIIRAVFGLFISSFHSILLNFFSFTQVSNNINSKKKESLHDYIKTYFPRVMFRVIQQNTFFTFVDNILKKSKTYFT